MESDQICLARCINRNIMECKELAEKNATNAAVKVLIETLWNVKNNTARMITKITEY